MIKLLILSVVVLVTMCIQDAASAENSRSSARPASDVTKESKPSSGPRKRKKGDSSGKLKLHALIGLNLKLSIEDLNSNIATKPSPLAYLERGAAFLEEGDLRHALLDYSKSISLDPTFARAYLGRATAYQALGKIQEAFKDYDRAANLQDVRVAMYSEIQTAKYLQSEHRDGESIKHYDRLIKLSMKDDDSWRVASAYVHRGEAKLAMGNASGALADVEECLKWNDMSDAYKLRAECYQKMGRLNEALKNFDIAVERSERRSRKDEEVMAGSYLELLGQRATLLDQMGKHDLAARDRALLYKGDQEHMDLLPFRMH